jgi:hypothetical protein
MKNDMEDKMEERLHQLLDAIPKKEMKERTTISTKEAQEKRLRIIEQEIDSWR